MNVMTMGLLGFCSFLCAIFLIVSLFLTVDLVSDRQSSDVLISIPTQDDTITQPSLRESMLLLDEILQTTCDITQTDVQLRALRDTLAIIRDNMYSSIHLNHEGLMYHQWLMIEIAKRQKLLVKE